eukprot:8953089-Ditylum_brightwellii.AAC.1
MCNLPAVNYWIKHHLRCRAPQNLIRVTLSPSEYKELISFNASPLARPRQADTMGTIELL